MSGPVCPKVTDAYFAEVAGRAYRGVVPQMAMATNSRELNFMDELKL